MPNTRTREPHKMHAFGGGRFMSVQHKKWATGYITPNISYDEWWGYDIMGFERMKNSCFVIETWIKKITKEGGNYFTYTESQKKEGKKIYKQDHKNGGEVHEGIQRKKINKIK